MMQTFYTSVMDLASPRVVMSFLKNILFPPVCVGCDAPLLAQKEGFGLCPSCWQGGEYPRCRFGLGGHDLPDLGPHIASFDAVWLYEKNVRELIHRFKFGDTPELVGFLAGELRRVLPSRVLCGAPLLVPVPLHWQRLMKRHYNQAALLIDKIHQLNGMDFHRYALARTRPTPHQTGKSRTVRHKILSKAFASNPVPVKGRHIILIDDVWTTGATAKACAASLTKAGAASIHVRTLAFTPLNG